jgi:peroxin-6
LSSSSRPVLPLRSPRPLGRSHGGEAAAEEAAGVRVHACISLHLELLPCPQVPRYALHLRVSVVRISDCGVLASLKINSASGESDYQDMIHQGLNEYFKFDRFLARSDVFFIHND